MKHIITFLLVSGLAAIVASGCEKQYKTYSDAEYVMFSDTLSEYTVLENHDTFEVPLASTTACDYDRTFGVEVIDKGSTAIEGFHYRLASNSVTIKAGERSGKVGVLSLYQNFDKADSLGFILKLVMPEQLKLEPYGDQTKVVMNKSCAFHIEEFTGWCVFTSLFLYEYPGVENSLSNQRLIYTEKHPTEENTIICHNMFFNGYDVTIHFDPSDPSDWYATMDEDQVLSDELGTFGLIHGDNKILVSDCPVADSYFNPCKKNLMLWIRVYVNNMGEPLQNSSGQDISTVGYFLNSLDWVSDEEADRIATEDGLVKRY